MGYLQERGANIKANMHKLNPFINCKDASGDEGDVGDGFEVFETADEDKENNFTSGQAAQPRPPPPRLAAPARDASVPAPTEAMTTSRSTRHKEEVMDFAEFMAMGWRNTYMKGER